MSLIKPLKAFGLFFCLLLSQSLFANDTIYENRRQAYIDMALLNTNDLDIIAIQAYNNGVVDTSLINTMLSGIANGATFDFRLVQLVRVLFLTNGTYDNIIYPAIDTVPFWLTKADTVRGYWSENHTIMWMSSDWLLHEKYGRAIDTALRTRLVHYLNLKIKYGFYESFSPTYAPYCFSGIINLSDFAQDPQIKSLATQAAVRLLRELLQMTNDKGVMYAIAGRAYPGNYEGPYGRNHNNLIYLLTGMGEVPTSASHSGAFLSTSPLEVDSIVSSWRATVDTSYTIGHSVDSSLIINGVLRPVDKIMSQWSSGLYFHPKVALESANLVIDSMLWRHVDFEPFRAFEFLPAPDIEIIANNLTSISMSSAICEQHISVFKHHSVTLSSMNDFWKGKQGYQQHPIMANVGTTAVYTASGRVKQDWTDRPADNANDHLPYIEQKHNVALIMYRAEAGNILLKSKDVALHFKDSDFDEIRDSGLWLLGRQEDDYVAVRRYCIDEIDSVRACTVARGQSWVIVVGDSLMYGSFNNFETLINQSQFSEEWYYDTVASQSVYYASITVDTISIDYAWRVDSLINSVNDIAMQDGFSLYPNPTNSEVTVGLAIMAPATIKAYNVMGQLVYEATAEGTEHRIATVAWPEGMYMIVVEQNGHKHVQKLLRQ